MENEDGIFANLMFKLVRKRIAGPTIATALKRAKEINAVGMGATITFLNDHVDKQAKAKYNANAYRQLLHQISRLNIRADASIRISQLGYNIDRDMAVKLLDGLLSTAKRYGVTVWCEYEPNMGADCVPDLRGIESIDALGVEVPYEMFHRLRDSNRILKSAHLIKLVLHQRLDGERSDRLHMHRGSQKSAVDAESGAIVDSLRAGKRIILHAQDENELGRIASKLSRSNYGKNLILEVPFGYSKHNIKSLLGKRLVVSVYTPYGRDWIPYAVNRLTEGKIHRLASIMPGGKRR